MAERPKVEVDPSLVEQSSAGKERAAARGTILNADAAEGDDSSSRRRGSEPPSRKAGGLLGIPLWGWVLVLVTLVGALLLVLDLRNRDRYLMVCHDRAMELHRGRRIPLPFGHEPVGGEAFRPVALPPSADCRSRFFASQVEAEQGFLQFVVARVSAELDLEEGANLPRARKQILQAQILSRSNPAARTRVARLLAEVDYREGRDSLNRVETELRTALARFKEARKLDGRRYADLDQWIRHLELLLKSVAPTPGPLPGGGAEAKTTKSSGKEPRKPSIDGGLKKKPAPDAGPPVVEPKEDPGGILL